MLWSLGDNDPKYKTKEKEVHNLKATLQDSHQDKCVQLTINNYNRLDQLLGDCESSCEFLPIIK